jgi:hypothetical protein
MADEEQSSKLKKKKFSKIKNTFHDSNFDKNTVEPLNLDDKDVNNLDSDNLDELNENDDKSNEEIELSSKLRKFVSDDLKRKYSFLAICGIIFAILLLIYGISVFISSSDRVVDSVASGENGVLAVFFIIIAIFIFIISIFTLFSTKNPFRNTLDAIKDFESSKDEDIEIKTNNLKVRNNDSKESELLEKSDLLNYNNQFDDLSDLELKIVKFEDKNEIDGLKDSHEDEYSFKDFDENKDFKGINLNSKDFNESKDSFKDIKNKKISDSDKSIQTTLLDENFEKK